MASLLRHCCTPVFAEFLAPRTVALSIAAMGAAQLGAGCLGYGLPCGFHAVTGLPCPGCGLTRSVLALLHGHVGESLRLHPMGPVLFCGMCVIVACGFMPRRLRQQIVAGVAAVERRTGVATWLFMLLLIVWGLRITGVLALAAV
jgi:hypothetical protein